MVSVTRKCDTVTGRMENDAVSVFEFVLLEVTVVWSILLCNISA